MLGQSDKLVCDSNDAVRGISPTTRRAFLVGGATAALGAVAAAASAQQQSMGRPMMGRPSRLGSSKGGQMKGSPSRDSGMTGPGQGVTGGSDAPLKGNRYWMNNNLKLLRRITYGPRPEDISEINSLGFSAYLEKQLNYSAIDDSYVENLIASRTQYLNMDIPALMQIPDMWKAAREAADANIYRSIYSKRQLHQKMVEFWSDHFYVDDAKLRGGQTMVFQRDVIWAHALGNFKDMLHAAANSSGLIFYLDNQTNRAGNPNVNLAREIMELHTIGVDAGYTEEDIYQVGRILTGWGIVKDVAQTNDYYNFHYFDEYHEPGDKIVMGKFFPYGGKSEGDALLDWLALHPKTGEHIGSKLVQFFLGYEPTTHQKTALGEDWVNSGGDIRSLLRLILTEDLISSCPMKFKRPFHLFAGLLRQSPLYEMSGNEGIIHHLVQAEHMWFKWNAPNGYPDRFDFWAPGMIYRLNYALQFCNNKVWSVRWKPDDLMAGQTRTAENVIDRINQTFFAGEMSAMDQLFMRRYLRYKSLTDNDIRGAVGIALGSPGYQWC